MSQRSRFRIPFRPEFFSAFNLAAAFVVYITATIMYVIIPCILCYEMELGILLST